MHLALGLEQIRVVQSNRRLLADACEEEKFILIERAAVGLVDQFDDAQHFVFFAQRRGHPALDFETAGRATALFESWLRGRFVHKSWINLVGHVGKQAFGS